MSRKEQSYSRINGWSLPLHPLQGLSWVATIIFVLMYFCILVPAAREVAQIPLYTINAVFVALYLIFNVVAVSLNPADREVRQKQRARGGQVPELDPKHSHVIENFYCNLCELPISSPRTKHCKCCNKCIADFDHHCKWLNNCVGSRNYSYFIGILVTACLSLTLSTSLSVFLSITFYTDQSQGHWVQGYHEYWINYPNGTVEQLKYLNSQGHLFRAFNTPIPGIAFFCLAIIDSILALFTDALLLHLVFFHVYLRMKGMTTYEFIVAQRQKTLQLNSSAAKPGETSTSSTANNHGKSNHAFNHTATDPITGFRSHEIALELRRNHMDWKPDHPIRPTITHRESFVPPELVDNFADGSLCAGTRFSETELTEFDSMASPTQTEQTQKRGAVNVDIEAGDMKNKLSRRLSAMSGCGGGGKIISKNVVVPMDVNKNPKSADAGLVQKNIRSGDVDQESQTSKSQDAPCQASKQPENPVQDPEAKRMTRAEHQHQDTVTTKPPSYLPSADNMYLTSEDGTLLTTLRTASLTELEADDGRQSDEGTYEGNTTSWQKQPTNPAQSSKTSEQPKENDVKL